MNIIEFDLHWYFKFSIFLELVFISIMYSLDITVIWFMLIFQIKHFSFYRSCLSAYNLKKTEKK